jgi:hypothetical protein
LSVNEKVKGTIDSVDLTGPIANALGDGGYQLLGVAFFAFMGITLYRVAQRKQPEPTLPEGGKTAANRR